MNDPEFRRNVLAEMSGIRKALEEISKEMRRRDACVVKVPNPPSFRPAHPAGDPPRFDLNPSKR